MSTPAVGMDDTKARAREYNRKMKQLYRREEKKEVEALHAKIRALETALTHARKTALLSWEDVAMAVRETAVLSVSQNRALKIQLEEYVTLVGCMRHWVASVERPLNAAAPTWRNVMLSADPTTRRLGKEWITKQMYHNAGRVLTRAGFPPSLDEEFMTLDIDFSEDDGVTCGLVRQYTTRRSLPAAVDHQVRHICSALMIDGPRPDFPTTTLELTTSTVLHRMETRLGEAVELLCGTFTESPTRSIVVVQQIDDDEAWDHNCYQRQRRVWYDMQTTAQGTTSVRMVYSMTHAFRRKQRLPLGDEARLWGVAAQAMDDPDQLCKRAREIICSYVDATRQRTPTWETLDS
ncbi:Aste57867_1165 [Aphanomyces stellatus]|uniref:Aste57867_1165 protein n=1 Tax=Aphanomyces stellatus TaxID=120398 RepID=A0A485K9M5_9STRA|nr:hypothetical protein As57867_001164 [Aphanomyces stellatus]VFT78385.1 Aste57867_1165 [Aphanomyces stellatus]